MQVQATVRKSLYLQQSQLPAASIYLEQRSSVDTLALVAIGLKETRPCQLPVGCNGLLLTEDPCANAASCCACRCHGQEAVADLLQRHLHADVQQQERSLAVLRHLRRAVETHARTQAALDRHLRYFRVLRAVQQRLGSSSSSAFHPQLLFHW